MPHFLGTAQIQLQNLTFHVSRDKIPTAIERLAEVFLENCDPVAVQNQIPVYIWPSELQHILGQSQATIAEIQRGQHPYPRLYPPAKVRCLHGRQRYEAALQSLGPQTWWVVRIYCIAEGNSPETLLLHEMTEFSLQTPYSDGEVFRRVYTYQRAGQWKLANDWRLRLSNSKQKAVKSLLHSGIIGEKMYELTDYPGLSAGLQLGNVQKHLALHCDEEICNYLQHIKDTWSRITLNSPEVRKATDIETVEALQLLAPSCGYRDQETVKELMRSGNIFSRITNSGLRQDIEQQLLDIEVVIPSIETFHGNMRYFSIGMRILRDHLLGPCSANKTVAQAMRSIWRRPETTLIEYAENQFHPSPCHQDFSIAYHTVFISALRNFPRLSTARPNKERGQAAIGACIDDQYLERFLRHALAQGFTSDAIKGRLLQLPQSTPPPDLGQMYALNAPECDRKRRSGIPRTTSYNVISRHLFLPKLLQKTEISAYPSVLFVQMDFVRSFFHGFPPHDCNMAGLRSDGESIRSERNTASIHSGSLRIEDSPSAESPSADIQLTSLALSAAVSSQDRRRMLRHDSESGRSFLSPQSPGARRDVECASTSDFPSLSVNDATHAMPQTAAARDAINSIRSRDTQSSAATERTILGPYDIHRYMVSE